MGGCRLCKRFDAGQNIANYWPSNPGDKSVKAFTNGEVFLEEPQLIEQTLNSYFTSYTSSLMDFMRICWPEVTERQGCIIFSDVNMLQLAETLNIVGDSRSSVEAQLNRRRLIDMLPANGPVSARDLAELGQMIQAMWKAKLKAQFPNKTFSVIFSQGKTGIDTENFELTFFQNRFSNQ